MFIYPYRNTYLYRVRSNERESQEKSACPTDSWCLLRAQSRPVQSRLNTENNTTHSEPFVIRNYVYVLDQQSEADQDPVVNIRV
jgi:hypothetical protein